jgi:GNAT superfamily N-acetyltransferase
MDVRDLTPEDVPLFSQCLEDWSDDAREGAPRRLRWIERMRDRGLRAHLALTDDGTVGGMIQHLPIEHSTAAGEGLAFIPCVWVHGHPQGRGDLRGHGLGSALLEAAEADARARGALGMAAWGLWLPFWMRASWFRRHGYRRAALQGMAMLVWKPFEPAARPPRWHPAKPRLPAPVPGKVNVVAFSNGWCMALNLGIERARRAAAELGDTVAYTEIDTSGPGGVAACGIADGVFVDGKSVSLGPPPSYEKVRKLIARRVERLRRGQ